MWLWGLRPPGSPAAPRPTPQFSLSSLRAATGAPTEVLSCQRKFLVKPLVDKAPGQIVPLYLPDPRPRRRGPNCSRSWWQAAALRRANWAGTRAGFVQLDAWKDGGRSRGRRLGGVHAAWDLRPGVAFGEGRAIIAGWSLRSTETDAATVGGSPCSAGLPRPRLRSRPGSNPARTCVR